MNSRVAELTDFAECRTSESYEISHSEENTLNSFSWIKDQLDNLRIVNDMVLRARLENC